jgi:hypothetical protein
MNSKRMYFLLITTVVLMIGLLVGGTYLVNSMLTKRANDLTALKAKNAALGQEQISLNKAKKDLANYADLYKTTRAVVPEEKNSAEAAREIVNIADAHGISLASITFPASSLGSSSAGASSSATTSTAPAAPTTLNSKTVKLSQLTLVKGIPGVYNLVITVTSDPKAPVPYNQFVSFLSDLEHNRHTAEVSSITLQPDKDNHNLLSFNLNLNEYIKP